jgi:hypothetical protein
MNQSASITRFMFLTGLLIIITLSVVTAKGQDCEGAISRARSAKNSTYISVGFLYSPTTVAEATVAEQAGQWVLNDLFVPLPGAPAVPPAPPVKILSAQRDPAGVLPVTDLLITLDRPLDPAHTYHLAAPNLIFDGCKPKKIPQVIVSFSKPPTSGIADKTDYFPRSKAKGREDSNVYLSGDVEGAEGGSPQVSSDVKIDIPQGVKWGIFKRVGPYFNLKASTSEEADANSLNFGAKISAPFNIGSELDPATQRPKKRLLRGINWHITGGFESDRRFDNVNVLMDHRVAFVPSGAGDNNTIFFKPFVGFELGRNLNSPVAEAEDKMIARGYVGGSLYINLYPKKADLISFQTDYIRRFLLKREIYFKEEDDKTLLPLNIGRGPRDYVKTTLSFAISDFTAINVNYEYGSLPPNFQLVNHKYSLGLVYKFKTTFSK